MGYSTSTGTVPPVDATNPEGWVRSVWTDFVDLWPKILGLEHQAATIAATTPAGPQHDAAVTLVKAAASLASLQTETQKKVEETLADLGVGAIVTIAIILGLATIMAYIFARYFYLSRVLSDIESGTITADQVPTINSGGPSLPDLSPLGAGKGILLAGIGIVGVLAALHFFHHRRLSNPDLILLGANPQPDGVWSREVISLDYIHDDDGQAYTHSFGPSVHMQGLEDGSVRLYHPRKRIWRDF